jgi:hypothetical protein
MSKAPAWPQALPFLPPLPEDPFEVPAEDLLQHRGLGAELVERRPLGAVNDTPPAAREERGIRSEQQPVRAGNGEGAPKDVDERQPGKVPHPAVGARRVEMDVRTGIGRHQRLAEEA